MFCLKDQDGKLRQICLKSCCQVPFNQCAATPCAQMKRRAGDSREAAPYLHVDLGDSYWSSASELIWAPIVEYLLRNGVWHHILPSADLKSLTPSAGW
jgi:hypothetical protein